LRIYNPTSRCSISTRDILVGSFRFYMDNFIALFFPFLAVSILKCIIWNFAFGIIPKFEVKPGFTEALIVRLLNHLAFTLPFIIAFILISRLIDVPPRALIIKYTVNKIGGADANLSKNSIFRRMPSFLLLEFIKETLIILGLFLFVIPGLIMAVIFSLTLQVIVIEGCGIFKSLRISRRVTAKASWTVFSVITFLFILTILAIIVGEIMCDRLMVSIGYMRLFIIFASISAVKPLQPVSLTYLYLSLSRDVIEILHGPIVHPRFCPKCGQRLPPDALYCPSCGCKVVSSNSNWRHH